jgi:hypothetical protein
MVLRRDEPFGQVVVPDHKELDRGTLRAILPGAGVAVEEFIALWDKTSRLLGFRGRWDGGQFAPVLPAAAFVDPFRLIAVNRRVALKQRESAICRQTVNMGR